MEMQGRKDNATTYFNSSKGVQTTTIHKLIDLVKLKPGDSSLDLGCGTGNGSVLMSEKVGANGKVFAIDPDMSRIKVAKETNARENICYINATIANSKVEDCSIDCVISNFVMHWIHEKRETIKVLHRLMKKDSLFAFTTIERLTEQGDNLRGYLPLDEREKAVALFSVEKEDFYRDLAQSIGFEVVSVTHDEMEGVFETEEAYLKWFDSSLYTNLLSVYYERNGDMEIPKNSDGYCIDIFAFITCLFKKC